MSRKGVKGNTVEKIVEKAKGLKDLREEVLLKRLKHGKIVIQKVRNPKNSNEFYRIHLKVNNKLKPIILIRDEIDMEVIADFTDWFRKNKNTITEILEELNGITITEVKDETEEELLA